MKKILKKTRTIALCLLLSLAMLSAALPASTDFAEATTVYDAYQLAHPFINEADPISNSSVDAIVSQLQLRYPDEVKWPGGGECYGFAVYVTGLFASGTSVTSWTGLKNTKTNFMNKVKGCRAGTHIRVSSGSSFSGSNGHSFVFLGEGKNGTVYWADNNNGQGNQVHYWSGSWENMWASYSGFTYLNRVTKPTGYKSYSSINVKGVNTVSGNVKLFWPKTSGASEYKVYRSTSKTGTYSLIKTTTSCKFTDTTGTTGKRYYYYVKAGSKKSGVVSFLFRTGRPSEASFTYADSGAIVVHWDAVKGASKYAVYRIGDLDGSFSSGDKLVYVATTSNTYYTDKETAGHAGNLFRYEVRALTAGGVKSCYSEVSDSIYAANAKPKTPENAAITDYLGGKWVKFDLVDGADGYYVMTAPTLKELKAAIKKNELVQWDEDKTTNVQFALRDNLHQLKEEDCKEGYYIAVMSYSEVYNYMGSIAHNISEPYFFQYS